MIFKILFYLSVFDYKPKNILLKSSLSPRRERVRVRGRVARILCLITENYLSLIPANLILSILPSIYSHSIHGIRYT